MGCSGISNNDVGVCLYGHHFQQGTEGNYELQNLNSRQGYGAGTE